MLKLNLDQGYTVTKAPVKIGSYVDGKHQYTTVHMDLNIPAGFNRSELQNKNQIGEQDFFAKLIANWEGLADQDGNPIPCTAENKDAVLKVDAVIMGLYQTLVPISMGQPLVKNS